MNGEASTADIECIDITNNEVDVNNAVIAVKAFKTEVEITEVRFTIVAAGRWKRFNVLFFYLIYFLRLHVHPLNASFSFEIRGKLLVTC